MDDRFGETFAGSFAEAERVLHQYRNDRDTGTKLVALAGLVTKTLNAGSKILVGGNGGSMADAMHFAEEWTGRFRTDRRPWPVMVLGGDPTHLSCVANDYGFEQVFARSVSAFALPGDLVLLLTTTGNSENLIQAALVAKQKGVHVTAMVGQGGGRLASICDLVIHAPGTTSDRIQELQMLTLHTLIEAVERELELE